MTPTLNDLITGAVALAGGDSTANGGRQGAIAPVLPLAGLRLVNQPPDDPQHQQCADKPQDYRLGQLAA